MNTLSFAWFLYIIMQYMSDEQSVNKIIQVLMIFKSILSGIFNLEKENSSKANEIGSLYREGFAILVVYIGRDLLSMEEALWF